MKTLKKTLCLVLAVVLVVGTLILPAAADNAAAAPKVDADAETAFKVLQTYDVIKGVDKDNKPAYDSDVTRAEVAAIVYRIMTGDTLDTKVANYASKADVYNDKDAIPAWAKGYIGYATDKGIFGGDEKGNFNANSPVTGVQLVKVLLCCIGYGQNHEFEGKDWAKNTLSTAGETDIFGVKSQGTVADCNKVFTVSIDTSVACKRGNVFKLVSNAVKAPRVTYFAGSYSNHKDDARPSLNNNASTANLNTGLISVNVESTTASTSYDDWGIPTTKSAETSWKWSFNNPVTAVTGTKVVEAAVTESKALYDSFEATSTNTACFEDWCDIADKIGEDEDCNMKLIVNGRTPVVQPLDVSDENGGISTRGRHTLIYANPGADKANYPYIMVQIDTYLARVTTRTSGSSIVDKNGHEVLGTNAQLKVRLLNAGALSNADITVATLPDTATVDSYVLVNYCEAVVDGKVVGAIPDPTVTTEKTICLPDYAQGVTIKEITMAAGTDNYVGFVDSTGKQYYYSNTFVNANPLKGDSIGNGTYNLTLDKQGFVLDYVKVTASDSNVGVILSRSIVSSDNGYKIKVNLLNAKGENVEITLGRPSTNGDYYADKDTAQIDLNAHLAVGNLIHYTLKSKGYTFDKAPNYEATENRIDVIQNVNKVVPGRVDFLDDYTNAFILGTTGSNGFLVDDNTVFFVAQNVIDNTTVNVNDYKFTGTYAIYTSFKKLPILTVETGNVSAITGMAGQNIDINNLSIQAMELDGSNASVGEYAKYVVINGSTKQITTPETISKLQYAFIFGDSAQKQVGDTYYTFNAFINGEKSTIKVSMNAAAAITENGLYAYGTAVNVNGTEAYTEVKLLDDPTAVGAPYNMSFKLTGYSYSGGVITDATHFFTVADGCKVYAVAPQAHEAREVTNGVAELNVYSSHDIWVQFDETGAISLIYINMA